MMKSDPISYLVILRSGPLGRVSKDDSQFLKVSRPFILRGAQERAPWMTEAKQAQFLPV
jgi:hypothetical protein